MNQAQRRPDAAIDGAGHHIVVEELLQDLLKGLCVGALFALEPIVEGLVEARETIEKGAAVKGCGRLEGLRCRRLLEPAEGVGIGLEAVGRQGEAAGVGQKLGAAAIRQGAPEARQGAAQVGPGLGFGLSAPEQAGQPLAAVAAARRGGQKGEKRTRLAGRKDDVCAALTLRCAAAEQRDLQDRHGRRPPPTPGSYSVPSTIIPDLRRS